MFLDTTTVAKFLASPENREKLAQTWPARAAQAAWSGVTLPGDVWARNVDPMSEDAIQRATDLAGIVMTGTGFSAPRGALGAGPTRIENPILAYHGSPHDFDKFDPDLVEIIGKRATGGKVENDEQVNTALSIAEKYAEGGPVTGFLHTDGNGRTDNLPMKVPNGAYVIPADIVSSMGQGNTLAGKRVLETMFTTGPYGMKLRKPRAPGFKTPRGPKPFAAGGNVEGVDIIAAGGEFVIDPETVAAIGGGDMNKGHQALDIFVKSRRKKAIQELKTLPGPERD